MLQKEYALPELSLLQPGVDLLPLLRGATNKELDVLVEIITKKGWQSSELNLTNVYHAHAPNHEKYPDEIAAEIQKFGGNTIANLLRGHGRPYRDIVRWSAKNLRVRYKDTATVAEIDLAILAKEEQKLETAYQKMTDEMRAQFLKDLKIETSGGIPASLATQSIQVMIRDQGFRPYIWLVKNANWLWRGLTGAGLSAARNRVATKMLSWILAPEVGIALTAIDTLRFAASPARRIAIPCVIHIATMRQKRERIAG